MKKQVSKNRFKARVKSFIPLLFIIVSLLFSCKSGNSNNKLIPVKDLVNILTELYIADGIIPFPDIQKRFSSKDSTENYVDIIQRHGYSKERMDKTMRYYFDKKPKKLENILDQVLTNLNEKEALLAIENPPALPDTANLWTMNRNISVPETGIKDPVWFSISIKDTGSYVLEFSTIVFNDDQSINPKVTVFFWHTDSSKAEYRTNWPALALPKDGQRHYYALSARNSDTTITHVGGWLLDSDPKEGRYEKHAIIENIRLRKASIE
jgi:hypothetical protein